MIGQIYIGPVACNFPGHFSESDVKYGNFRCFTATYLGESSFKALSTIPTVSSDFEEDKTYIRTLYQYVPLILILQAMFLRIPYFLWKFGERKLGIHFDVTSEKDGDNGKSVGIRLAVHLMQWIEARSVNILSIGSFTIFHCFIKLLYLASVATHFGLLDHFLKKENHISFGLQVLENIRESDAYFFQTSPAFPREIYLTYAKVSVHSITKQKVQCILPFNSYLEQIMVVILVVDDLSYCFNYIRWLCYFFGALRPYSRSWFVKSNLLRTELENSNEELESNERQNSQFANWLGGDVIQFLQNIQDQENGCVVMETITELWRIKHNIGYSTPRPSNEEIHGMVTSFLSYVRAHINGQTERTDV